PDRRPVGQLQRRAEDRMVVYPAKRRELGFRVSSLLASPDGKHVLCRGKGRVLVMGRGLAPRFEYSTGGSMRCWKMSPDSTSLLVSDGKTLSVFGIDGRLIHREKTVVPSALEFDDCLFSADNESIWTIRHIKGDQVELEVRETASLQVMRR